MECFFHAGVGETDDELAGVGGGVVEVDLDLAGEGVDAGEEIGLDAGEYGRRVEEKWRGGQVVGRWAPEEGGGMVGRR